MGLDRTIMSDSGKRITTVISCTTVETVRVSDPALFYEADRLHIIYMSEDDSDKQQFYSALVDEIEKNVRGRRDIEVIRHNDTVYRFNTMLHLVNEIIKSEKEEFGGFVDIYVNISSGSSEYAAAAMCACMMNRGCTPFTVAAKDRTIPFEKYRELISRDGHPIGNTSSVHEPKMVKTFNIEPPDEDLVRYLIFFDSLGGRPYTRASIMRLLESNGIWKYESSKKDPKKNSATMKYRRDVLMPLLDNGWIINVPKNRWIVTPAGRAILDIFTDEDDKIEIRDIIEEYAANRTMICNSMAPPERYEDGSDL